MIIRLISKEYTCEFCGKKFQNTARVMKYCCPAHKKEHYKSKYSKKKRGVKDSDKLVDGRKASNSR